MDIRNSRHLEKKLKNYKTLLQAWIGKYLVD
jgi:hypothetical protein